MKRVRLGVLPVAVALLVSSTLAGCAGPEKELAVGIKDFPTELLIGEVKVDDRSDTLPLPPVGLELAGNAQPPGNATLAPLPGLDAVPSTTPSTPTTRAPRQNAVPAASACPTADPLLPPKKEAFNRITGVPAAQTYATRTVGAVVRSGATGGTIVLPPAGTRTIQDVSDDGGGNSHYTVVDVTGDTTTTTRYRVDQSLPDVSAGLFIVSITTQRSGGAPTTFNPIPAMLLFRTPAEVGESWDVTATDPVARRTMSYRATLVGKKKVDACGTPLDGYLVRLAGALRPQETQCERFPPVVPGATPACKSITKGGVSSGGEDSDLASFEADYVIGTQYGGLALQDQVQVLLGASSTGSSSSFVQTTVNVEPLIR